MRPSALFRICDLCLPTIVRKDRSICEAIWHLPNTAARSSSMTMSDPEFCKDLARFMIALDAARPSGAKRVSSSDKENCLDKDEGMVLISRPLESTAARSRGKIRGRFGYWRD